MSSKKNKDEYRSYLLPLPNPPSVLNAAVINNIMVILPNTGMIRKSKESSFFSTLSSPYQKKNILIQIHSTFAAGKMA
ncbi:hypothetical protein ACE6ED_02870 [Paenibacillus sp. CN-4]|uniref:hypothetical protein n=1 Tax=Paenibacillus nanchangensis TaxID=3348343 RepID=UPI00397D509B